MTTTQQPLRPVTPTPTGRSRAWRFWRDVPDGAPRSVFAAAAVAAVVTALTEPYAVVGVAGLLTGLAVCAGPVAVAFTRRATRWRLFRPLPVAAGVAVVALLAVGTSRDAGWLYALCVLAALGLGSYALAGGTRWTGVVASPVVAWVAAYRGAPWLIRGAERRTGGTARYAMLRTLGVAVATLLLLTVFGTLLAGADAAFAHVVEGLVPELTATTVVLRGGAAFCAALLTMGAAFAARVPPRTDRLAGSGRGRLRAPEWAVPVGALVLLFAGFVAVQFTALFGGDEHVRLTEGLTYAEYARSGFAYLVAVTLLTLAVLAAVGRLAPRESAGDRLLVRVLGGALCLLTLVIVASALYRMHLYQEAYGFTRLRVVVLLFEAWLGVLFLLALVAGVRLRAGWFPRAVVGTAAVAVLGLALANPDALVAERNVVRYEQTGRIDTYYLNQLSADAAPALDRLPEPLRSCAMGSAAGAMNDRPWYAENAANERLKRIVRWDPVDATPAPCP